MWWIEWMSNTTTPGTGSGEPKGASTEKTRRLFSKMRPRRGTSLKYVTKAKTNKTKTQSHLGGGPLMGLTVTELTLTGLTLMLS